MQTLGHQHPTAVGPNGPGRRAHGIDHVEQIRRSIGSVGDASDNALMETINGLYKAECIRTRVFHDGPFKTLADIEYATAGWVDRYDKRRLHSTLGMVPPVEYEQAHYAARNPAVSTT